MSITSISGSSTTSCQRVVQEAKPKRSAASATALWVRPARVRSSGESGRSKKWWAVRQAWEWDAHMNPYTIMPIRREPARDIVVVIVEALLLVKVSSGTEVGVGGRCGARAGASMRAPDALSQQVGRLSSAFLRPPGRTRDPLTPA